MELQQILGVDKRNPCFTICRNTNDGTLHFYYGAEILEKLPDVRDHPQYKLMVARLYNAGVNATKLRKIFGFDFKTMRRWARALESGDAQELVRVLAGRQAGRKFTLEIQAFTRVRFSYIYSENKRSYSKQIREEIKATFDTDLSSETLRPFFGKLKKQFIFADKGVMSKGETPCDIISPIQVPNDTMNPLPQQVDTDDSSVDEKSNRKGSPFSEIGTQRFVHFVHHAGVLLFSDVLQCVEALSEQYGWLLKQWLATILIGAVNIEQSKLLDFEGLNLLLGRTLKSHRPQRVQLAELANTAIARKLYNLNALMVGTENCDDFYYDPHTKHYTGEVKTLKGWCASKHFSDKALHMDFIHTSEGNPVYIDYADNYKDMRERFSQTIVNMRTCLDIQPHRVLRVVVDRAIYSMDIFEKIISDKHLHVLTWEKNYQMGQWDEGKISKHFLMERTRNNANDLQLYRFEYQEEEWKKNSAMRLIRVRATNPKNRAIELGVLSDEHKDSAEKLLRLMFRRWLQENDFKYLEKHYGINQITSYASIPYSKLKEEVEDRQIKSGEYKALEKQRTYLRTQLKKKLLSEHWRPRTSNKRTKKIGELSTQEKNLTEKITETKKETSRLDSLIKGEYCKLNPSAKKVMDALKLIARNSFYRNLQPFKKNYNNYRDDHVIFRNLTHAHGLLIEKTGSVEVRLFPTMNYPPARRKIIEKLLEQINASDLVMPNGVAQEMSIELGEKMGIELAY